ncbi:MAG: hypothetical protein COS90_08085, partial [Deltaproteobacteria bacterium CG07_land_8_20_14_0_80_60_11]
MRLVKEGSNYTSQYSLDGNTYQQVADPINYNFGSPAYLGFVALQGSTHYETAAPVTIDYFSVDPLTATANAYDFTFTYNSGDSYRGAVIATPAYGYSETYTQAINTETGPGAYIINRVIPGYDPADAGQVTVDRYFDAQSGRTFDSLDTNLFVSPGDSYLGSESGYIIQDGVPSYLFGSEGAFNYEADLINMTNLGAMGGYNSEAHGINALGQVVGYTNNAFGQKHAFVYDPATATMTDLGTVWGNTSQA